MPDDHVVDSSAWRAAPEWRIIPERLDDVIDASSEGRVFVCGSAANEAQIWGRFSVVIALVIDEATLRRRLDTRTDNNFGKSPEELAKIVGWLDTYSEDVRSYGAIVVDGSLPVEAVADAVLYATAYLVR